MRWLRTWLDKNQRLSVGSTQELDNVARSSQSPRLTPPHRKLPNVAFTQEEKEFPIGRKSGLAARSILSQRPGRSTIFQINQPKFSDVLCLRINPRKAIDHGHRSTARRGKSQL